MSNTSQGFVFSSILINATTQILSGQLTSSIYDCILSPDVSNINHGASSLRTIIFPSNWTTCDVTFLVINPLISVDFNQKYISDGQNIAPYTIPGAAALLQIDLLPYCFDTINQIQIVCNIAQANTVNVGLLLQSIYQGQA